MNAPMATRVERRVSVEVSRAERRAEAFLKGVAVIAGIFLFFGIVDWILRGHGI